jgi:hypothetical protein
MSVSTAQGMIDTQETRKVTVRDYKGGIRQGWTRRVAGD